MGLWQSFSAGTRRAVVAALGAARRRGGGLIDSGDLLLGLLRMPDGTVHEVLRHLGVQTPHLRMELERRPRFGTARPRQHRFSEDAKDAIILARQEAHEGASAQIEPHHILLGLLRACKGPGYELLAAHGAELEAARKAAARVASGAAA